MPYPNRIISKLEDIFYYPNLNIFSDASTRNGTNAACYGVIAVCGNDIIDTRYRIHNNSNSASEELRGIRAALCMGIKYRFQYPVINIFSDSLYSILTLREYPYKWKYDSLNHNYITVSGSIIANQPIIAECFYLLDELRKTNQVNIYHQKGHVNGKKHIAKAASKFNTINHINGKVDQNLIRYISTYNNYVDQTSRSILMTTDVYNTNYRDAVEFVPLKQIRF